MRAVQRRERENRQKEHEGERERPRMQAMKRGNDALVALGKRIGADDRKLGKAARAGAKREAKRRDVHLEGSKAIRIGFEHFTPGPSTNWTERD
jgi:hypothetical protein